MTLKRYDIARMVDISAVRADSTFEEVQKIAEMARKYSLICTFAMPSFTSYLVGELSDRDDIKVGGVVGFPSGGETTATKVFQAQDMLSLGCDEIDMVMNIGKLKSGMYDAVLQDIKAVKKAIGDTALKVIIEVALLSDQEIVKASQLVLDAGAQFVKSGTGWAGATTLHHVKLITDQVGGKIKIKVAGGVRDKDTLKAMYDMGVERFGIGYKAIETIMSSCDE